MTEKNLDSKGRWRNVVVAFRVSQEESCLINEAVKLSGLTKQDYIIKKLLNRDVVVAKSPRTYKALKERMDYIIQQLEETKDSGNITESLMETIKYVTNIYIQTKED